jgi:CRISPR-associated protein Cas2
MVWLERDQPGGQAMRVLGDAAVELVDVDGLLLLNMPCIVLVLTKLNNAR